MINDTTIHPTQNYVLAELIELEDENLIKIPDKFKGIERDEDKQQIIVLEDSHKQFKPGTRILAKDFDGLGHNGRKLMLIKHEDIKGWYDTVLCAS